MKKPEFDPDVTKLAIERDLFDDMIDALIAINDELDRDKNLRDTMSKESQMKVYRSLTKAGVTDL